MIYVVIQINERPQRYATCLNQGEVNRLISDFSTLKHEDVRLRMSITTRKPSDVEPL